MANSFFFLRKDQKKRKYCSGNYKYNKPDILCCWSAKAEKSNGWYPTTYAVLTVLKVLRLTRAKTYQLLFPLLTSEYQILTKSFVSAVKLLGEGCQVKQLMLLKHCKLNTGGLDIKAWFVVYYLTVRTTGYFVYLDWKDFQLLDFSKLIWIFKSL